jgi:hypothetical protein
MDNILYKQGCPDYLTPGGLTLKTSKIRGWGSKFYLEIFSRQNFPGGLHPLLGNLLYKYDLQISKTFYENNKPAKEQ